MERQLVQEEKFVTVLQVDKVLGRNCLHDFLLKIRRKQTLGKRNGRKKMVVSDPMDS
jgi:hypothetical protein